MSDLPPPPATATPQPSPTSPEPYGDGRSVILVVLLSVAAVGSAVLLISTYGSGGSDADDSVALPDPALSAPATVEADPPVLGATDSTVVDSTVTDSTVVDSAVVDSAVVDSGPGVPPVTDAPTSVMVSTTVETTTSTSTTSTSTPPATTDVAPTAPPPSTLPDTSPTTTVGASSPETVPEGDALGYPVLPDGSPVPVEAVYEGAVVTLTGLVPSQDARVRLEALAVAGAPQPNTVAVNLLEINENVPNSVGARVLSLDSVRFPEGSNEITPEHADELDGTIRTLEGLPNVTMLVIGHADQRGDDLVNLALSQDRADGMVLYLVSQGIDPSRLSSRAVGESDPISSENSDAALQLNRRTELVFYGLLAG